MDLQIELEKFLGFDDNGELVVSQELGTFKGNWSASTSYAARDIVKDTSTNNIFLANTGHTSSGSQPLTTNADSAKWDLLVDAAASTTAQTAAAAIWRQLAAASSETAAGHICGNSLISSRTMLKLQRQHPRQLRQQPKLREHKTSSNCSGGSIR